MFHKIIELGEEE